MSQCKQLFYYVFLSTLCIACIQEVDSDINTDSSDSEYADVNTTDVIDDMDDHLEDHSEHSATSESSHIPIYPEINSNDHLGHRRPNPEITQNTDHVDICLPQPTIWRANVNFALDFKHWVDELDHTSCTLVSGTVSQANRSQLRTEAYFGNPGDTTCYDRGCWVTLASTSKVWQEEANIRDGYSTSSQLWIGMIDARRNLETHTVEAILTASHTGTNAVHTLMRRWDADGHILFESHKFKNNLWSEITYTWSGDLLISVDSRDFINHSIGKHYDFSYDEHDRLVTARLQYKNSMIQKLNHWTYDEQGRPQSVNKQVIPREGSVEAQTWLKLTWSYTESGQLASKVAWFDHQVMRTTMIEDDLDSYDFRFASTQKDWDQASLRWDTQADCMRLPTGLEYGYPSFDQAYDLGWKMNDRPADIDVAHGYVRGYRMGHLGWFGHFGAQGGYNTGANNLMIMRETLNAEMDDDFNITEIETNYQNDQVLSEYAFAHRGTVEEVSRHEEQSRAANNWFFSSGIELMRRQWTWNEGLLVDDTLSIARGRTQTLHFEYNDHQRLITRSLHQDQHLIARHDWTYLQGADFLPSVCQIAEYQIRHSSSALNTFDGFIDAQLVLDEDQVHLDLVHTYTVDMQGYCEQVSLISSTGKTLTLHFDAQRRLVRKLGIAAINPFTLGSVQISYDDQHNMISRLDDLNDQGQVTHSIEGYEFNEQGKLSARYGLFGDQNDREDYSYECQ